jgi:hypothetical protein
MSCKECESNNQCSFRSEVNIHFPGFQNLNKPSVWAFPELLICLDCGFAETRIEERELRLLVKGLVEGGASDQDILHFKRVFSRVA